MKFNVISFLGGTLIGLGISGLTISNADPMNLTGDVQAQKRMQKIAIASLLIGLAGVGYTMMKK